MIGRGPVPLTEIEKELVRSRVDHYFSNPNVYDTPEEGYERLIQYEWKRIVFDLKGILAHIDLGICIMI